ncbi:MAG TPA: hypothetical protein EYP73_06490 [Acidimicrobiia bacterium]|nr:hypothetical protein [Acidimicrobiia bacterium]
MNGPIRRLALGLLAGFGVLLVLVSWFQVVRADALKNDPRNPRPALTERGKERGLIATIDGTVVARSVETPTGRSFVRIYPEGEAFAHSVGYSSFLVGDTGLEAAFASDLRSRRDLTISDLISAILGRDLRPKSIEITIDARLQRAAREALGDQQGAVVALDPATGAILAAVSTPSFDPNPLVGAGAAAAWDSLLNDPGRPLFDRATRELFAPGSTFKTVVMATALDTGIADPETEFPDVREFELPGSTATISNFGGGLCQEGATVTLLTAFVRSCNTVFADLTLRLGAERSPSLPRLWASTGTSDSCGTSPRRCGPREPWWKTRRLSLRVVSGNATFGPRRCIWQWLSQRWPTTASPPSPTWSRESSTPTAGPSNPPSPASWVVPWRPRRPRSWRR